MAEHKTNRVLRGGSWNNNDNNCKVANRNNNKPDNRNNNNGLRLAILFKREFYFMQHRNKREQNSPGHILPDKKGEYHNRGAVLSIASLRKVPLHLY